MTDRAAIDQALEIALKALRTLHRNGISDDIAGTALNDIQDALEAPAPAGDRAVIPLEWHTNTHEMEKYKQPYKWGHADSILGTYRITQFASVNKKSSSFQVDLPHAINQAPTFPSWSEAVKFAEIHYEETIRAALQPAVAKVEGLDEAIVWVERLISNSDDEKKKGLTFYPVLEAAKLWAKMQGE